MRFTSYESPILFIKHIKKKTLITKHIKKKTLMEFKLYVIIESRMNIFGLNELCRHIFVKLF